MRARLTRRENAVLARARRGDSNKAIAASLGIAASTVSTHLARAARKGERVFSAPISLDALTPAEQHIVRCVSEGKSNAEIARERGSSARTVANQLQSIYCKLGVSSRRELCAACSSSANGVSEGSSR